MVVYTTEWAKRVLILFPNMNSIWQCINGIVVLSTAENRDILETSKAFVTHTGCFNYYLPQMLEHPKDWQNSLVTREDL